MGGVMRCVVVVLMLAWSVVKLPAQTPAARPVEEARFDVVSIKPISRDSPSWVLAGYSPDPTRFHGWFGYTDLLSMAYQMQPYRIVGMPKWTSDERYEITATISTPRQRGDLAVMIRHLLEERFSIKAHRERRPMPVYALVMSRDDGRLGPSLKQVERACAPEKAFESKCYLQYGVGLISAFGWQWTSFVADLERMAQRPVLDKTGLSGLFDIRLEWNPEMTRMPDGSGGLTLADLEARPILFTAVKEQLGLKLESATESIDVVVIDSIQRPTAN